MGTKKSPAAVPEQRSKQTSVAYQGTIARSGASEAIRLEKALFRSHAEFQQKAKVRAVVVSPGHLLVSVVSPPEQAAAAEISGTQEEPADPVMTAFLSFLGEDMHRNPQRLRPLTKEFLDRIGALVENVEVDDDEVLPEDVTF